MTLHNRLTARPLTMATELAIKLRGRTGVIDRLDSLGTFFHMQMERNQDYIILRGLFSISFIRHSPCRHDMTISVPPLHARSHLTHSLLPFCFRLPAKIHGLASQKSSRMISTCSTTTLAFCFRLRSFSVCVLLGGGVGFSVCARSFWSDCWVRDWV